MNRLAPRRAWLQSTSTTVVVAVLLCLAALNVIQRASWSEVEDGVLWRSHDGEVAAAEVAPGTAAAHAGIRRGDILQAINGKEIQHVDDVIAVLHASADGTRLSYTLLRQDQRELMTIAVQPIPSSPRGLYFTLAAVGIFSLLVGASVRLRRPDHQATLHFFWLTVAFFGAMALKYTGKFDTLDWTFYWGNLTALLLLPPLFLHFALVFPDRPDAWVRSDAGRKFVPLFYLPALLLGAVSVASVVNGAAHGDVLTGAATFVDRAQLVYLAVSLIAGLAIMVRALGRVRSVTARRQLRWIVWGSALGAMPFAFGYALPFAFGLQPLRGFEFTVLLLGLIPLAFASAIVRYRLMDVEVIIKRALVYAAVLAAIAAIYAVLLWIAGLIFYRDAQRNPVIALLATLVVVSLSRPVKNAIQAGLDRMYYRDRYDYRRALVGFARDLNSDLDLLRLSERLVQRVTETLLVDRMALMLAPASSSGPGSTFITIAHAGFPDMPPSLGRGSEVGTRMTSGHTLVLDESPSLRRLDQREADFWREAGIHYFVPCVSKEGTIAVMALGRKLAPPDGAPAKTRRGEPGEPLSSEDMALLSAVAAQAATALENGRLYRELRTKADELERMRQFSENILESLNDGLAVLDRNGRVIRWNRQLEELYGVRHEDAVGRAAGDLLDAPIVHMLQGLAGGTPEGAAYYKVPLTTRHEPPRRLLVNLGATPLRDSHADVVGSIVIIEDISSRVQLEEQLQISEKMASIGLLAAGVAHEVNTPLTGISSFTQMLLESASPEDPKTQVLEKIERQTFRAAKIVNGLLNLARPAQVDSGPCDINVVINDVLSLLEHQLRTGSIQVRKELAASAPTVQGIEHKLQQVFLNLFLNSRDAMPKGGWLTIVTHEDHNGAVVEVGDTGSGIPADMLSRIYDPFFTTKAIGKGTGLGLSIAYGIVQEHGGTIACDSQVGQGTRFTIRLPLAESRPQAVRAGSNR
jgi:two-component system, NtrC family, sensor kinase